MNDLRRIVAMMLRLAGLGWFVVGARTRPVARIRNVPVFGSIIEAGVFSTHSSVPVAVVWIASSSTVYWAESFGIVFQRRGSAPVAIHWLLTAFRLGDGTLAHFV